MRVPPEHSRTFERASRPFKSTSRSLPELREGLPTTPGPPKWPFDHS